MTTLVMLVIVVFGAVCYFALPVSCLPSVDYPVMTIQAVYPGASPATMASTVATPLENECMQINGIQYIISDNRSGFTTITLVFDLHRNIDLVAPDVQAAISRAQKNLPTDLPTPPSYSKDNPAEKPIMYLMVNSDTLSAGELYDYANRIIGKRLSIISGVSKVQIWGAKTAVRIAVDPAKLAAYGIGINEISSALASGTVSVPGGSLDGEFFTFSIEPKGQMRKAAEYEKLIVAYRNGAPVRLGEVAACVDSLDNDLVDVRYGHQGGEMSSGNICMAISRQGGANTVSLAKTIVGTLDVIRSELPASVTVEVFHDNSQPIKESIADVQTTILLAVALVVVIIFFFIGRVRETIIPCMTLPIAIVATFILMYASGFDLDTLSLMALVLSVGFLVDDAIVVLENTVRHVETGLSPIRAAIKSMGEITFTVISTSVALIIVFVPLVFMGGVVGRNFQEFALTVVYAITVSTLLALTLTPMMCSRMLKPAGAAKTRIQVVIERAIHALTEGYGRVLYGVLRHRYLSVIAWVACIAGSVFLFNALPKSFIPPGDSGLIFGVMMMHQGAATARMRAFQDDIDRLVLDHPAVKSLTTITGHTPGAEQNTGYVIIALKPHGERQAIDLVKAELDAKLAVLPYGFCFLSPIAVVKLSAGAEATESGSQYSYTMRGNDRETLYDSARRMEAAFRSLDTMFTDIQNSVKLNMPQVDVRIDRDRASSLGITAMEIEQALSLSFAQGRVATFTTDSDQYDVIVEVASSGRRVPGDLSMLRLHSAKTGELVPIGAVAEWNETVGPQSVPHSEQMDAATISFNLKPGVPLGAATAAIEKAARETLPPEVSGSFQGEAQEFQEAIASLVVLMFIAIFLMYVVLGILYESYIHPFTVLTTLPVAAFGGLATLLLFRSELSLYAYIGMFTLLGIIAKNGIMMIDFTIQRMEEGMNAFDAIHDACKVRFRPILMTGVSTIFGALPIAMGYGADGASRIPLGLIIVGGMAFAQVVTLFVTPGIFLYMDSVQEFLNRFEMFRSGAARRGEEPSAPASP